MKIFLNITLCLVLIPCSTIASFIKITAEYRNDTIDFDDSEKNFFRERISIILTKKSSITASHIHIGKDRTNRFTWNISLLDLSPYFEMIAGNYYINFGTGLFAGKINPLTPDIYTKEIAVSRIGSFTPCSTGNPRFSFQGLAMLGRFKSAFFSISLGGFFSLRSRYSLFKEDSIPVTENSFRSILYRTEMDYKYSEPVTVCDYGAVMQAEIRSLFTLQAYFLIAEIKGSFEKHIAWNYSHPANIPQGEKMFFGYGFFGQYKDDAVCIFIEAAFPGKKLISAAGHNQCTSDYGFLVGFKLIHPFVKFTFTGKITGDDFYTYYGSGNSYAEEAVSAGISLIPVKMLTLGLSYYSQKKLKPSFNESDISFLRRENLFLKLKFFKKSSFTVNIYHVEKNRNGKDRLYNIRSSLKMHINNFFSFSLSGRVQKKLSSGMAYQFGSTITASYHRYLKIDLQYKRIIASKNNTIFTDVAVFHDSISAGQSITKISNMATASLYIKIWSIALSARYRHHFLKLRTIKNSIDVMCRMYF